jgi:hypothetical protein
MRGLLGKKLGMTQVFDEESGVVTSVTVIEAGPCPVVAVRTPDVDGYEAVQLAWEPVADRKVSKAERGHLAKNGVAGAYRHLVEFRGHFSDDARLAQHPQAGLDRGIGHPVPRLQGHQDGRPHGCASRHAGRAHRACGRRGAKSAADQGCRTGTEERDRPDS